MSNVAELTTPSERDQQVVALRLAGVNLARIAREVGLGGTKEVIAALERALPTVDAAYRGRILREELARSFSILPDGFFNGSPDSHPFLRCKKKLVARLHIESFVPGIHVPHHTIDAVLSRRVGVGHNLLTD
jgi:hypothetical protein